MDANQWHTIAERVFRAYDIRGHAEMDLTDEFVYGLGYALGQYWQHHGVTRAAVGRDGRLHSQRIHDTLLLGLGHAGVEMVDIGVVPTPMLYFAVHHLQLGGGVQITASHNPAEDNGFKILLGTTALYEERLQAIRSWLTPVENRAAPVLPVGSLVTNVDLLESYLSFLRERLSLGPRRGTVVVDGANGPGGMVLVTLLQSLNFRVIPLGCEIDGRFPHHPPDPTVPENLRGLQDSVRHHHADVGLALDGDADRLIAVDNRGRMVLGDQLFAFLTRPILQQRPGALFLTEVKCSQSVLTQIEEAGGRVVMGRVGHSVLKDHMKRIGAVFAGELSGHLFFADRYLGFDDGIYAAGRLLEWLSHDPLSLAEHVTHLPLTYSTPEIRLPVNEQDKIALVQKVRHLVASWEHVQLNSIDGVRIQWPDGWALIRASNTQPMLSLRFEATTPERLQAIRRQIKQVLEQAGSTVYLKTL